jgi:hypothetical protein
MMVNQEVSQWLTNIQDDCSHNLCSIYYNSTSRPTLKGLCTHDLKDSMHKDIYLPYFTYLTANID